MRRLLLLIPLLGLGTGCMSLDFMFLDGAQVDAYDLSTDLVPAELIEQVSFERSDGVTLQGVWLRQDLDVAAPPLIYFHGNGSNLETEIDRFAYYWSWGRYDVFAPDYGGFGASDGDPTWEGLAELDGPAAVAYVSETTGYAAGDIPWVALSLGGFVAIHTNDQVPAQAIVLQSVFADSDSLVDSSMSMDLPPGWFFEDDWDNVSAIPGIASPVLVIHGLADDYVLPESGPRLYEAAPGPDKDLWQPEGVGHADVHEVLPEAYRDRALAWFDAFLP